MLVCFSDLCSVCCACHVCNRRLFAPKCAVCGLAITPVEVNVINLLHFDKTYVFQAWKHCSDAVGWAAGRASGL